MVGGTIGVGAGKGVPAGVGGDGERLIGGGEESGLSCDETVCGDDGVGRRCAACSSAMACTSHE